MIDVSFSETPADFVLITLVLGGGAAFLVGRAVAVTWRGLPSLLAYLIMRRLGIVR